MADDADIAAGNVEAGLAAALSRIDASIPSGVAGECDECGERMPRLVGGRCGFCRDGRRPPLSFFDRPAPVAPTPTQEDTLSTIKPITLPPHPAIYALVQERIAAHAKTEAEGELPLGRALVAVIEELLTKAELPPLSFALDAIETGALLSELERRLSAGVSGADYQAAIDRAVSAEAKLAAAAAALGLPA